MSASPFPPHIRKIGICAPAGAPKSASLQAAVDALDALGIDSVIAPNTLRGHPHFDYISADHLLRIDDLQQLWADPSIDLIIPARGGYGCMHLLPDLDWTLARQRNLPILGYSDITALHLALLANGCGNPIAGINAAELPRALNLPLTSSSLAWSLNQQLPFPIPIPENSPLQSLKSGSVIAPLFPVNLTLLDALIGTPYLPDLRGAILLLEEIDEPLRKIDRMLTHLDLAGILPQLAGLAFGSFFGCDSPTLQSRLFQLFAAKIPGPVIMGVPFGHQLPTICIPMGVQCQLIASSKPTITLLPDLPTTLP